MRGQSILRPFLLREAYKVRYVSTFSSRIPLTQGNLISASGKNPSIPKTPVSVWTPRNPNLCRHFSDAYPDFFKPSFLETEPVTVPENVVPVKTEEEFNTAVTKIEGESVPAVIYFTATWCAPCRFIGPVMDELARRTPEVTIFKIDIDEESLAGKLKELNITAVPTIQYFKEGKKKEEVIGSDATRIVHTMKRLYNMIYPKLVEDPKEEISVPPEEDVNDNLIIDELIPLLKQVKKANDTSSEASKEGK